MKSSCTVLEVNTMKLISKSTHFHYANIQLSLINLGSTLFSHQMKNSQPVFQLEAFFQSKECYHKKSSNRRCILAPLRSLLWFYSMTLCYYGMQLCSQLSSALSLDAGKNTQAAYSVFVYSSHTAQCTPSNCGNISQQGSQMRWTFISEEW